MTAARLIVIRHGETSWNAEGRYQGHLDSPLTALGLAQAHAIARRLVDEKATALYSSDLVRARKTAEIIGTMIGLEVRLEPRLREQHLGVFQGLSKEEVKQKFPDERRQFKTNDPNYLLPGGESARQAFDRMMACFEELACRHAGETAVIVGHGGTVTALLRHTLNLSLDAGRRFRRPNAGWNVFACDAGRWVLETWGDLSHLAVNDGGAAGR
jgi:probable phosphoglycerate mutase